MAGGAKIFLINRKSKKVSMSQFDKCVCGHRRLHHFRMEPNNPLSECKKCKCLKFKIA